MWTNLGTILWKNLIIRKRHLALTILEILVPILLFTFVAYGRSKLPELKKEYIKDPIYHEISSIEEIYSSLDVESLQLWYSPYTDFTESIIQRVQQHLQIPSEAVREFTSKNDLLTYFEDNFNQIVAVVNFDNATEHLIYDLTIYEKYFSWKTDKLFIPTCDLEEKKMSDYLHKGYAALQVAIDMSFIELLNATMYNNIQFSLQEFPEPPQTIDSKLNKMFVQFLPLITIFSFLSLCPAVLQRVGEEKFSGTKEFMKMVGLKSSTIWFGWFTHALITNMFSIIAIVILMKVPFFGVSYPPVEFSDGTVLFVFLFLYCMSSITFCFLIATIVNTPSVATVIGVITWLVSYFVPQVFMKIYEYIQWKYKIPLALFPNMALYYGYSSISVYEIRETGMQWSNIFEPGSGVANDITMGQVLFMLLFDTTIYFLLTLYIENVRPGPYGIPKPVWFPINSLAKFAKRCFSCKKNEASDEEAQNDWDQKYSIVIRNLYKKFHDRVAVDNLNLDIHRNKITALLGQNGAGKTTTMSILTGMINATSGTIKINGKDIEKDTEEVRKLIGLCPQHNLLFPDLTVLEHLMFFAKLKGSTTNNFHKILKLLELDEKKNELPRVLSGGQKRKLCLAMALTGDSEVLILDEPTSGMDPESRRKVWDVLLEERKTKTILLSTHFMEEADVLGDEIAIIANGRLYCNGTPRDLKIKYNTGCHLSLVLNSGNIYDIEKITKLIKKHFPEAKDIRKIHNSVVYLLPLTQKGKDEVDGSRWTNVQADYKDLIQVLERTKNVNSISLNETTLNDVFLKAKYEDDSVDGLTSWSESSTTQLLPQSINYRPVSTGFQRQCSIFLALLYKRFCFLKQKICLFIPTIIIAILIFFMAVWLVMSSTNCYSVCKGDQCLKLTLETYGEPKVYYGGEVSSNSPIGNLKHFYSKSVQEQNGVSFFEEHVSNAIINTGVDNIAFYKHHMIVAAEFNLTSNQEVAVNSMYSPEALHSLPISINLAMNAIVKTINKNSYIRISNTPLRSPDTRFVPETLYEIEVMSVWVILIPISLFFMTSIFLMFPNAEISTGFTKIQKIAGVNPFTYWSINILFDSLFFILPLGILFGLVCLVNILIYKGNLFYNQEIVALITVFNVYAVVSLPFVYLLSHRKTVSGGFALLKSLGILTGIAPTLIIAGLKFSKDEKYIETANWMAPVLESIFPQFGLSYMSLKFSKKYVENFNWRHMDPKKKAHICKLEPTPCCFGEDNDQCHKYQNYFQNDDLGIQIDLCLMSIGFIIYFAILLAIHCEIHNKLIHFILHIVKKSLYAELNSKGKYKEMKPLCNNHSSVKKSTNLDVKNMYNGSDCVTINSNKNSKEMEPPHDDNISLEVKNVYKLFGKKRVVDDVKFSLKKGECFGLLGVNGAGKSTTFRMLTKHLIPDAGQIILDSKIPIHSSKYSEKIGYCPQEDCLNFTLTARELLKTLAYIKGYSGSNVNSIVNYILRCFDLENYADKPCSEYSGGNKRKLSASLAFLGSPRVILLDEPTSGVDPASRENFWETVSSSKRKGASVLLCSHSMEESEKLCEEVAIMKDGEIKDVGTLPELKNRYQKGYKISIKLKSEREKVVEIKNKMEGKNAELTEEHQTCLSYQLIDNEIKLSQLLEEMEILQNSYNDTIEDYSVNSISLEDIFLTVAENKVNESCKDKGITDK